MTTSNASHPFPEDPSAMSNTQQPNVSVVPVHVTKMPPPQPLFRDTSRLVAVAAFILSLMSVLFTWHQTLNTKREATIDTINKLIDHYYEYQEKLTKMDATTQVTLMNLLRSRAQSMASSMTRLANRVQGDIDAQTWLAVAQINDSENNFSAAEAAWSTAIRETDDIYVYLYATRNLASNLLRQGRADDASRKYQLAIDATFSNIVKGTAVVNSTPSHARYSQAALTHAYWLHEFRREDCPIVVPHFDSAVDFIANASRSGRMADLRSQEAIVAAKELLSPFREARKACGGPHVTAAENSPTAFPGEFESKGFTKR
jgi:tetratricopeptide (TPR) repeat protein